MKRWIRSLMGLGALAMLALATPAWAQDGYEGSQSSGQIVVYPEFGSTGQKVTHFPDVSRTFSPNPKKPRHDAEEPPVPNSGIEPTVIEGIPQDSRAVITNAWEDQNPNGWLPPDPNMALGPSDLITATNDDVRFYSRTGTQLWSVDVNDWTGNNTVSFFDPKVIYDRLSSRFIIIYMYIRQGTSLANSETGWWMAVSDNNTAEGGWWWYYFNAGLNGGAANSEWADFPYIGHDNVAYCLSARMFGWFGSGSDYSKLRFLRKSEVLSASGAGWWDFWGLTSNGSADHNICPLPQQSSPGSLYTLNSKSGGGSGLTLRKWNNTDFLSGGPNNYDTDIVATTGYSPPPNADQPGAVQNLDTIDTRVLGGMYSFGKIYTTLNSGYDWGGGNVRSVIWNFRLTNAATPVLEWQDGAGNGSQDWYYPQITTTWWDETRSYVTFAISSNTDNPGMVFGARLNSDAGWAYTWLHGGEGTWLGLDSFGRNRWGDYFGTAPDPWDDWSVGLYGMYGRTGNSWRTYYARMNHKPSFVVSPWNVTAEHSTTTTLWAHVSRSDTSVAVSGASVLFYVSGTYVGTGTSGSDGWAPLAYAVPFQLPTTRTVTAVVEESTSLNRGSTNSTLTITKHTPLITVYERPNFQYAQDALLHGWLRQQNGTAISGETISFTVNGGAVGTQVTDSTGDAWLNWIINLVPGSYPIVGSYAGNSYYNAVSGNATLGVILANTSLVADNATGTIGQSVNLTATLTRVVDGWLMNGYTIAFQVGGVSVGSAVTNASGVATRPWTVTAGNLGLSTIQADFAGTFLHAASSDTATFTGMANTTVSVANLGGQRLQTVPLGATLTRTHDGALITGRTINFTVDGVGAGGAVTNGSGIATLNYVIPAAFTVGGHAIGATFAGDAPNYLNPSSGSGTLTVNKWDTYQTMSNVSGTAGQAVSFTSTLRRTIDNAPVAGKTIRFLVAGVQVGLTTTNGSGSGTVNWTVSVGALGPNTLTCEWFGDADYNSSLGTAVFTRVGKTLGGTVVLQDWTATRAGQVANVNVYNTSNVLMDSFNVVLNASGVWSRPNSTISTGTHRVEVKVWHWLNRASNFSIAVAGNSSMSHSLINGDVDNDNEVGPGDFGALSAAFGSMSGDSNWNAAADLDGDGEVGPSDFAILSANFGTSGD